MAKPPCCATACLICAPGCRGGRTCWMSPVVTQTHPVRNQHTSLSSSSSSSTQRATSTTRYLRLVDKTALHHLLKRSNTKNSWILETLSLDIHCPNHQNPLQLSKTAASTWPHVDHQAPERTTLALRSSSLFFLVCRAVLVIVRSLTTF